MSNHGAFSLCRALSYDRRLVLLSLRANALTADSEGEFVELMRDHRALARVDMRQNLSPGLGILKVRCVMVHMFVAVALKREPWGLPPVPGGVGVILALACT